MLLRVFTNQNKKMKKTFLFYIILTLYSLCSAAQQKQVFHDEIRKANPSPVYDFIERYFAELETYKDVELLRLRLKDDKVEILEGSLTAIRAITPETPFSMNRMEDSFYQISWLDGVKPLLTLRFPVNYELLLGMPKVDIEKKMKDFINAATESALPSNDTEVEYELMDDGCYKTKPALFYQLAVFNDARYFSKTDTVYSPIFDESHNWYSAANLFHNMVAPADRRIYVEQNLYGGEKTTYTVSLSNWLNYCAANSLHIYFCIEEEREDGLKALLVAQSNEMNYNHMMQIIIPDNFIEKQNCIIKATLNAFIPTQNVKDLYKKYTARPKKKI